jgi:hypothetical protein
MWSSMYVVSDQLVGLGAVGEYAARLRAGLHTEVAKIVADVELRVRWRSEQGNGGQHCADDHAVS